MKRLVTVGLIVAFGLVARGDEKDKIAKNCEEQAKETGKALLKGDYEKLLDRTYPKLIELAGGREAMLKALRESLKKIEDEGFAFKSVDVDEPSRFGKAGDDRIAVVPMTVVMTQTKPEKGTITTKGYLLGISGDDGKTWTFIDGAKLDSKSVKLFLPKFPDDFKLPEKPRPKFEKAK
ncbi:MAG TPA: hypothetical protein VG406_24280 [Isosphaeraceae bacterium]|jgi:hypothetical protein|nr:hypothetical protein [Isosphaeraceae bacterium]